MAFIEVCGGAGLYGSISVQGSKNEALPILAACLLCGDEFRISNCPRIQDVFSMEKLLGSIGCETSWEGNTITVNTRNLTGTAIQEPCAGSMRSSLFFLGPMLARCGEVSISPPGGCRIGERPIELHKEALESMNALVAVEEDRIFCRTEGLRGAFLRFRFPSVGATENAVMAAILAEGNTRIQNAAREPEIVGLCRFLKAMGADISGEGTREIHIRGVKKLHGAQYRVMSDRIAAGTYMAAAAGAGGEICLKMDGTGQLLALAQVLRKMGASVELSEQEIRMKASGRLQSVDVVQTEPYPGFPTDMQSQIMAVLAGARGESLIIENIFEERFKTAEELKKMGAHIETVGNTAFVEGVEALCGSEVAAPDLRGGAALIIAGLSAEGTTRISEIHHILRGYERICGDFNALGGRVRLVG